MVPDLPRDGPAGHGRRLFVAGAGAAGTTLALALVRHGHGAWTPAEIACRTHARAQSRRDLIGSGEAVTLEALADPRRPSGPGPALLLIAVPDRAIGPVAEQLAARPWPDTCVALHLSGSVEIEALAPLARARLSIGGLHPLKSFVDPDRDADGLAGTVMALEGDAEALAEGRRIAAALVARPFELAPGRRAAWHAGAAHACNHFVALVDQALDLLELAGLPRDAGRAALVPLLAGTLEHLADLPPAQALTGPVVRGDLQAVERHLKVLADEPADVNAAYRALARRATELAAAQRGLPDDVAAALRRTLENDR